MLKKISHQHFINEMNGVIGHLCARIGYTKPGEPPGDGEINEMTLPSWHRTRNSSSGGLTPSTPPLSHGGSPQYWIFTSERGKTFCFFETWMPERTSNPRHPSLQTGSFNRCPRAPVQAAGCNRACPHHSTSQRLHKKSHSLCDSCNIITNSSFERLKPANILFIFIFQECCHFALLKWIQRMPKWLKTLSKRFLTWN